MEAARRLERVGDELQAVTFLSRTGGDPGGGGKRTNTAGIRVTFLGFRPSRDGLMAGATGMPPHQHGLTSSGQGDRSSPLPTGGNTSEGPARRGPEPPSACRYCSDRRARRLFNRDFPPLP